MPGWLVYSSICQILPRLFCVVYIFLNSFFSFPCEYEEWCSWTASSVFKTPLVLVIDAHCRQAKGRDGVRGGLSRQAKRSLCFDVTEEPGWLLLETTHWPSALDSGMVPVSLARCDGQLTAVEAVLEEVEDGKFVA